jgi:hypothetical protein
MRRLLAILLFAGMVAGFGSAAAQLSGKCPHHAAAEAAP